MKYMVEKPTNCPNCNASLQSSVCQYCGTRVGWDEGEADISHEQVVIPIRIGGKEIDKVFQDFHRTAYDFGSDMRKGSEAE